MQDELVAYLEAEQSRLDLTGRAMAARLGISETNWSHIRRTRRRLPHSVFERAVMEFPGLADVVAAHAGGQAVAS